MADPESVVREQVDKLLKARADVQQHQFGKAIGRGASWVSAFLGGKRNANDVLLLVKIARFFGVSVGYLLRETDRGMDASARTLLSAFQGLREPEDRDAVLQLALTLKRRGDAQADEGSAAPAAGRRAAREQNAGAPKAPRAVKGRER